MTSTHKFIATPTRTTEIMKQYDIKMKKSLGQNFLIEPKILAKMMEAGQITQQTTALEIGPGIGALTEFLALNAKEVIAFEIDDRFVNILTNLFSDQSNVRIEHEDILKVDFSQERFQHLMTAEELVVVANLPYYITTPIIMHLLNSELPFKRLVMMMQKEVAERMTAEVGTKHYNSLTIAIQNRLESHISFIVPKNVFIPKPNVDSAVLTLERRDQPLVAVSNPKEFEQFVRTAFTQRRKTIWNNLRHLYQPIASQTALQQAFEEAGIDPKRRAESLDIFEFEKLYHALEQLK